MTIGKKITTTKRSMDHSPNPLPHSIAIITDSRVMNAKMIKHMFFT